MALPRINRLRTTGDFDRTARYGKTIEDPFFLIKVLPNGRKDSRVGIIVPSRRVKMASERNAIRRMVSETIRPILKSFVPTADVTIALRRALPPGRPERRAIVGDMISRIHI